MLLCTSSYFIVSHLCLCLCYCSICRFIMTISILSWLEVPYLIEVPLSVYQWLNARLRHLQSCNKSSIWSILSIPSLIQALLNSLWPSDTIWRQRSGSTLAQVMACCLMAPSHYLNQCWHISSKVEWRSSNGKFTGDTSAINHWNNLKN